MVKQEAKQSLQHYFFAQLFILEVALSSVVFSEWRWMSLSEWKGRGCFGNLFANLLKIAWHAAGVKKQKAIHFGIRRTLSPACACTVPFVPFACMSANEKPIYCQMKQLSSPSNLPRQALHRALHALPVIMWCNACLPASSSRCRCGHYVLRPPLHRPRKTIN